MSGSAKNVQRDAIYSVHEGNEYPPSNTFSSGGAVGLCNLNPSVMVDFATVHYDRSLITLSAGEMVSVGVAMAPPNGDRTPYRVRAGVLIPASEARATACIMVGFADASLGGGTNINVNAPRFYYTSDDLIMVEDQIGTIYEDRAVIFAVCFVAAGQLTSARLMGHLSVQNLGVKPPTMQNAVS